MFKQYNFKRFQCIVILYTIVSSNNPIRKTDCRMVVCKFHVTLIPIPEHKSHDFSSFTTYCEQTIDTCLFI